MSFQNNNFIDWNDLYDNPDISSTKIKKIAAIISQNKEIDLLSMFDLIKCSSKFCWFNFLYVLENMPIEERVRGLPLLFVLLQDENWPTYEKTVQILEGFDKTILMPYFKKYTEQAHKEEDDMWIDSMEFVAEKLQISIDK